MNLSSDARRLIAAFSERRSFAMGEPIIAEGDPGDGFYLIEHGSVRVEIDMNELDTDVVVGLLEPGELLGELSLLNGAPRSASAYAKTDVVAGWLAREAFDTLCNANPKIALELHAAIGAGICAKLRRQDKRLVEHLFTEVSEPSVDGTVARAKAAQARFVDWSETAVDALLADITVTLEESADDLAEATVAETGMGIASHKATKIRLATRGVYEDLAGKVGCGFLPTDDDDVVEIACPMGVVLGLCPVSNPVPTIGFKTLICLKSRNALILSCQRRAAGVAARAEELIRAVLARHGAPLDLVQCIQGRTGRRVTEMYMAHPGVSFILATGGASMVRAAYSSGTPSIGVGAGNAPVIVSADADLQAAARAVIEGKAFDCGMLCSSENNLVVERAVREAFIDALESNGAAVVRPDEDARVRRALFNPRRNRLRNSVAGKSGECIAEMATIARCNPVEAIVVPASQEDLDGPLGREKMAPLLSLFTVEDFGEALALSCKLLEQEGAGHTAVIHSGDPEKVRRFACSVPASRVIANASSALGVAGVGTGLVPSFTLGCGTLGGGSTSDNVTYTHLRNIKRLAFARKASPSR